MVCEYGIAGPDAGITARCVSRLEGKLTNHHLRPLCQPEIATAGAVLGRAFEDEPLFVAVFSDPVERIEVCTMLFTANLRHALRYGGAWVVGPNPATVAGAIYWVAKPESELAEDEMDELGYRHVFERWGESLGPIGRAESEAIRALRDLPAPWRYLAGVGVDPENRGRGYGSTLIRQVVEDAAKSRVRCALVTGRARNVPLYERLGFRTVAHCPTALPGVESWTMIALTGSGINAGGR